MRRRLLMAVLALGAIGGFGSGFAQLRHLRHGDACHRAPACECGPSGGDGRDEAHAAPADGRGEAPH